MVCNCDGSLKGPPVLAALAGAVQLRSTGFSAGKLYVYILVTYDMQAQLVECPCRLSGQNPDAVIS
jgi:hypothetical protein